MKKVSEKTQKAYNKENSKFLKRREEHKRENKKESKGNNKKEYKKDKNETNKGTNKKLRYVLKVDTDGEYKNKRNKEKDEMQKKRNNKRRSLSVVIPNYEKDIINNIKLADKIYKISTNKSSDDDSYESNDTSERSTSSKNEKRKNYWKSKKIKNRRSLSCGNYNSDSSNTQINKKFDININEVQTKYKNKNIKIIYDDGGAKRIVVKKKRKNEKEGKQSEENDEEDEQDDEEVDEESDEDDEDNDDEDEDNDDEDEDNDDEDTDDDVNDEEDDDYDDYDNECDEDEVDNKRNVLNNRRKKKKKESKDNTKKLKNWGKKSNNKYKKIKSRQKEKENEKNTKNLYNVKKKKKKTIALSDSYSGEKKKQNINKFDNDKKYVDMNYENMKRGNKRYSSVYEKRRVHNTNEYEENEKIIYDQTKRDQNEYYLNKYHPNEYNPNKYHPNEYNPNKYHTNEYNPNKYHLNDYHPNQYNTNNHEDATSNTIKNMYYSKEKKNTLHVCSEYVNIKNKELNNKLFLNIKEFIFKMHLNLENIKEMIKNKNDYLLTTFQSSYHNIVEYCKKNEVQKENFYKIIFQDLFSLLNEFIMVDDYTKRFFFSVERDVRQKCLENIKNEFYNFINKFINTNENNKNVLSSQCKNDEWLVSSDRYKNSTMNIQEMLTSKQEKPSNIFSTISMLHSNITNNSHVSGMNINNNKSYDQSIRYTNNSLSSLHNINNDNMVKSEILKIDRLNNDLVLKLNKSSIFQNTNDENINVIEYLKTLIKNEKEKYVKLEILYDEIKQKYDLLQKKREDDIYYKQSHISNNNKIQEEENLSFFEKLYRSQSIIKYEEQKLEDSSKKIVEENLKISKMKEINEQNKKDLEIEKELIKKENDEIVNENELLIKKKKDMENDIQVIQQQKKDIELEIELVQQKKEKIQKENELLDDKKKTLDQENELLDDKKKTLDQENELLDDKKKKLDEENILLEERKKKMDEENFLLDEKKKKMDEENFLLDEKKKKMDEENFLLDEKKKEIVNDHNIFIEAEHNLLNDKKTKIQEDYNIIEEELKEMHSKKILLEETKIKIENDENDIKRKQSQIENIYRRNSMMIDNINTYSYKSNMKMKTFNFDNNIEEEDNITQKTNSKIYIDDTSNMLTKNNKSSIYNINSENDIITNNQEIYNNNNNNTFNNDIEKDLTSVRVNNNFNNISYIKSQSKIYDINETNNTFLMDRENIIKFQNDINEKEKLLKQREEIFYEEKKNFEKEKNELHLLKENVLNKMNIIKDRENELNKKEEELKKMKELLLNKENMTNYSLNSSKICKDKLEYNKLEDVTKKEDINMSTMKSFKAHLRDTNNSEPLKNDVNNDNLYEDNISSYENNLSHDNNMKYDSNSSCDNNISHDNNLSYDNNPSYNTHMKLSELEENNENENENKNKENMHYYDKDNFIDRNNIINNNNFNISKISNDSISGNIDMNELHENLNNSLKEIEMYKSLLKGRDSEINTLKLKIEKQRSEQKWKQNNINQLNDISSDMNNIYTNGNISNGVNYDSSMNVLELPEKKCLNLYEVEDNEKMKSIFSKELISLYKEINNIKEEYNINVLKKNEFIGNLLLNFLNDLRNNYRLKENYYEKEVHKSQIIISEREDYIKELQNTLNEKKLKEISYKKMLLKMNQINDTYKLKNKRSLSTVELLKQDIKFLNEDVLKKNEMIKKFEVSK
ncbi:hypothetical protein PGSY75_0521900 [Plasmodium gaboni]|uniref:Uncharacterized protein n=1 Tax=Plasmodium gaboni TaxID=647221 RepID=A0A151LT87_9APIC|nr:hypothetical protein PGSY75_0521900 [Plasmodium gaboni]KYO02415.1 hypothetical protein PGSY75_0521900 [Plasmodium gaboni]